MARLTADYGDIIYYNQVMDRGAMRQLIGRLITYLGSNCTAQILDHLKTLGFRHATQAGISLGVDDLLTTPSKTWLIRDAEHQAYTSEEQYRRGSIHAVEKLRHVVETWHTTSEYLKREMTSHFRITDPLNPVHIMSFSGARGNVSQVHQLVGMRGLMANPQGNIIDLPIQSNLREGLSLTEYIISCYGARKGVVDTAVRTADAGYLTRRLVEVVQHVVIRNYDCETFHGIRMNSIRDRKTFNSLLSLQERLIGRVLARNVFIGHRCLAIKNQDLAPDLIYTLLNLNCEIVVRSPLTCKYMPRVCQKCYGWDLSCGNLVEIGTAIGIVAGQSIGEPGTQLTLRTFHTGGVFTGGVAEHVRAPFNGIIHFSTNTIQPTRNRHGRPAWTCPEAFSVIIEDFIGKKKVLNVPQYSLLLVKNHQYVQSRQIIAEVRASIAPIKEKIEKEIYSPIQGEIYFAPIGLRVSCLKQRHFLHFLCSSSRLNLWLDFASSRSYLSPFVEKTDYIWIFSGHLNKFLNTTLNLSFFYQIQDYIQKDLPIGIRNSVFNDTSTSFSTFFLETTNLRRWYFAPSPMVLAKRLSTGLTMPTVFPTSLRTKWLLVGPSASAYEKHMKGIIKDSYILKKPLKTFLKIQRRQGLSNGTIIESQRLEKIFNKHTGFLYAISEQNEWMLTLSFGDQFSKKISYPKSEQFLDTSFNKKIKEIEKLIRLRSSKVWPLSKTTDFLNFPINLRFAPKNQWSFGLFGQFFLLLKDFSIFYIRNFIFSTQISLFSNTCSPLQKKKLFIKDSKNIYKISFFLWRSTKSGISIFSSCRFAPQFIGCTKEEIWFMSFSFIIWCYFTKLFRSGPTSFQQIKVGQFLCKDASYAPVFQINTSANGSSKDLPTPMVPQGRAMGDEVLNKIEEIISLKRIIGEERSETTLKSRKIEKESIFPESGHILSLNEKNILIRLAKLYLVPTGTKVHNFHKQAVNEGDTLVTLAYERLKASDIIQGLPKAEQLLEARVGNQVVINLYMRFEILVTYIKKHLRNYIGSLTQMDLMLSQISVNRASKALEYSQLETVDQVQKVYLSQGVSISDKHFEVIVRQMSCKIAIVENTDFTAFSPKAVIRTAFPYDVLGVFFPGEILEISKAQRMNRVLYKPLPCKPILLGITQASLNANSFLSEASFERTITVLSRSALQGRMDWLKGLKENVLLSKMIPAGTGLQQNSLQNFFSTTICTLEDSQAKSYWKQKNLKKHNWKFFYKAQPLVCLYKPFFPKRNWLHKSLKQLTEQSLNYERKKFYLQQLTNNYLPIKKENLFSFGK